MHDMRGALDRLMHAHTNRIGRARFGVVSAVDPASGLVKVLLQPENTETGWMCDAPSAVGSAICYAPAEIGTHVLVETAQGDGDNYVVVARVFDAVTQPPLFAALGGRNLKPGEIGIKAGDTEFVVSAAGVSVRGTLDVKGSVTVSGDVKAANVSLVSHVHGGVKAGTDMTSAPQS